MPKVHTFAIQVEFTFNINKHDAQRKLKNWLESNGQTSSGHGFQFIQIATPQIQFEEVEK